MAWVVGCVGRHASCPFPLAHIYTHKTKMEYEEGRTGAIYKDADFCGMKRCVRVLTLRVGNVHVRACGYEMQVTSDIWRWSTTRV